MKNNVNTNLWLSRIGLGIIFCYCLLASIFFSYFAQFHLSLNFLPFPIFVGEIVLAVCVLLLVWIWDGQSFSQRTTILLGLYFGWVGIKALINYLYDGPLTCRNAALFYYPIFAIFAYCFYQKARIPRKVLMLLALLAPGIMFFNVMKIWYWWSYVSLLVIAIWNIKSVKWRWLGWIFLLYIIILGKEYFYKGPRAHFVSVFGAMIFLASYFGMLLVKRREYVRLSIFFISLLFFIIGGVVFVDRNDISSITSLKGIINAYKSFDAQYQAKQADFVSKNLSVNLYNPKDITHIFEASPSVTAQSTVSASASSSPEVSVLGNSQPIESALAASHPAVSVLATHQVSVSGSVVPASPSVTSQPTESALAASHPAVSVLATQPVSASGSMVPAVSQDVNNSDRMRDFITREISLSRKRSLDVNEGNIVFRLFIWRDMVSELIQERAWWGFSFGYPQRSKSLEVLHWAEGEWSRDGWITPHNSFFHIIYRAGILGVCFVGVLFFLVGRLVRGFYLKNSVEGGFLVSILIYWMVLSNFFVILELPYNAIVFWTLFGIAWAYLDGLSHKKEI